MPAGAEPGAAPIVPLPVALSRLPRVVDPIKLRVTRDVPAAFHTHIAYTFTNMKKPGRKSSRRPKRDLFGELQEGFAALADARQGKRTLRTHSVELRPVLDVSPSELTQLREERNISRGLLARYLRTNPRTLENWEQGRAKPNAQAALLINLVRRYPDTVERLARI